MESFTQNEKNNPHEMEKLGNPAMVESILNALREVVDPELQYNLVELGLIYRVEFTSEGVAKVKMTFTSPACPYGPMLVDQSKSMVERVPGVKKCEVETVFTPMWSLKMASDEIKATYQDFM